MGRRRRDPEYLPHEGRLAQLEAWAGATDLALTAGERVPGRGARGRTPHGGGHGGGERRWPGSRCSPPRRRSSQRSRSSSATRRGTTRASRRRASWPPPRRRTSPSTPSGASCSRSRPPRRRDGTTATCSSRPSRPCTTRSPPRACCRRRTASGARQASGSSIASPSRPTAPVWSQPTGRRRASVTRGPAGRSRGSSGTQAKSSPSGTARTGSSSRPEAPTAPHGSGTPPPAIRFVSPRASRRRLRHPVQRGRTRLATLGADRAVRVWDVRTGRSSGRSRVSTTAPTRTSSGARGWRSSAATASRSRRGSGRRLSRRGEGVRRLVRSPGRRGRGSGGTARVVDIDVSPDGTMLVAGQGKRPAPAVRVAVRKAARRRSRPRSDGPRRRVQPRRAARRHRRRGRVARTWDVARGNSARSDASRPQEADRERLVRPHRNPPRRSGTPRAEARRIWDVSPPAAAKSSRCPGRRRTSTPTSRSRRTGDGLSPPPDPRGRCASGARPPARSSSSSIETRTSAPVRAVIGVDVSPDGSRIATAGADGSARIFDAETGRQLAVIRGRHCIRRRCRVNRAVFSPDGSRIATTGRTPPSASSTPPRVASSACSVGTLRAASGRTRSRGARTEPGSSRWRQTEPASGTRAPANSCSRCRPRRPWHSAVWSPDGGRCSSSRVSAQTVGTRRAASGYARWRRARRRPTWSSAATGRAREHDGRRAGLRLRLWDWPAGVETLKLRDSGLRVALSPDGRLVATVRPRQPVPFVHVWALDPELLLQIARSRVTRSLTDEECRRYLQRSCRESG